MGYNLWALNNYNTLMDFYPPKYYQLQLIKLFIVKEFNSSVIPRRYVEVIRQEKTHKHCYQNSFSNGNKIRPKQNVQRGLLGIFLTKFFDNRV